MRSRTPVAILGVVALALGVLEMAAPGLLPVRGDALLVTLVGLLPLALAYRAVRRRRAVAVRVADPPDVEVPVPVPSPGADLDGVLESFAAPRRYARGVRTRGLREAAIAVLETYRGLDAGAARRAVETGEWTTDPVAAAFLARDRTSPVPTRLRGLVTPGSPYWRGVDRTIEAVCGVAGVDPPAGGDGGILEPLRAVAAPGDRPYVPYPADEADGETHVRASTATNRWVGIGALALVAVGAGTIARAPAVALAGAVGLGYAAYATGNHHPAVDLEIDRDLADERPGPGDVVDVTLTVRNAGERPLPDLRIVDGVPPALRVARGSPRLGTPLAAGESRTIEYGIAASRGVHGFEPVTAIAGDRAGTVEREVAVPVPGTLTCIPVLRAATAPVPLRRRASGRAGRVGIQRGGEGIEFHGVRAYRRGDPATRIDWRRLARTGTPATLEFREEHAARVALVIDARRAAYLAGDPGSAHAVDRSVDAAGRIAAALLDRGDHVGLAAIPSGDVLLDPGGGPDHRSALRRILATDPGLSPLPPDRDRPVRRVVGRLGRRLDRGVQVIVLSPLGDHDAARFVGRLDAAHPVTVVSADPTDRHGRIERLARVGRDVRIRELRRSGVPVVDWPVDTPLDVSLARAADTGWSP